MTSLPEQPSTDRNPTSEQQRPDEAAALIDQASTELSDDFGDRLPTEVIRQAVADAYDRLAANAKIHDHLGVLTIRQARRHLMTLTTTGAPDGGTP
jgi:hypothetical protein